jgi:gamma-glutamyltranspeptidase
VLAPAIELARAGFPAWDGFIGAVERTLPLVHEALGRDSGFATVYRPLGRAWLPGERVRLPALGATLERLAVDGFDTFYDGDIGERQARALAAAGSAIRVEDLRDHTSTWGEPIEIDYRGVRVTTHPPNSSGVVALELLGLLERFEPPAASAFGPEGVNDARWIHLNLEASKLAMVDRDAYLTDPAARDVPVATMLDRDRLATLAAGIELTRASAPAASTNPPGGGTIFLAMVDADGNAVSLIESNYLGFGSGVVDADTGIHYQNRGSYFSLDAGHPNVLEPRKRTLHTLLPGMLFRAGQVGPWIVVGSMGGDAQPQIHAQFVSAVVDGGLDIRTAITAPRFYIEPPDHFLPPTSVHLEPRHVAGIEDALRALGHELVTTAPFDSTLGHEHAIELVGGGPGAPDGSVAATTDPRSHGLPAVW